MTWAKFALLIPGWFMLSSATSGPALDVNEAGRVMAELDDWRALMFVMLFLIVLLVGALMWAFGKLAKVVEVMVTLRETIATLNSLAQSGATDARENSNAIRGLVATVARIEADIARLE
ncbi:hypothetical protein K3172_12870 [Qipengyuania sp. 6B39]|uniref:hypothetical protein n=1 Tax=Qipengyuania proteolytica TaxID=2867239 RepID=UPI001C892D37|nr:hypothetical protein [Qipengyuania proteolytica]MBX7496751.1 hypothetical protein [Qipengyuania proteolytica]